MSEQAYNSFLCVLKDVKTWFYSSKVVFIVSSVKFVFRSIVDLLSSCFHGRNYNRTACRAKSLLKIKIESE